jgi:hypothetical protein
VAFGVKAHSGWAALVALGEGRHRLEIVERRRLELVDAEEAHWAKQPYHAAAGLDLRDAEELVVRSIAAASRHAEGAIESALARRRAQGDEVVACGVLLGSGLPPFSVSEILAVHARMHQAEGELFRAALARAAERAGLELIGVREKQLEATAGEALSLAPPEARGRLDEAGRRAGPPWARDQKDAALCAWIALRSARRG